MGEGPKDLRDDATRDPRMRNEGLAGPIGDDITGRPLTDLDRPGGAETSATPAAQRPRCPARPEWYRPPRPEPTCRAARPRPRRADGYGDRSARTSSRRARTSATPWTRSSRGCRRRTWCRRPPTACVRRLAAACARWPTSRATRRRASPTPRAGHRTAPCTSPGRIRGRPPLRLPASARSPGGSRAADRVTPRSTSTTTTSSTK